MPRKKIAIFIDGDFWHGRKANTLSRLPQVYWQDKIAGNIARDKQNHSLLKEKGWSVLRVWETDVMRKRTQQSELSKIAKFLKT